jgi:hypothetical protein
MKTTTSITRKTPFYVLIGFLSLIITSCSSYQNSSYYDNDGIYSTKETKNVTDSNQPTASSIQYKQYFESLQNTTASDDEIFTDVNSYNNGGYNVENDSIKAPSTGYASWGSSPQETTVTVYPDSYWSVGFGWGYPYYGYGYPYYGYGYPYYGYGYPGYGWGYPGYGWGGYPGYGGGYPGYGYGRPIATPYAYNNSRRGSSYGGGYANRATSYNRNGISDRSSFSNRNNVTNRNSVYNNSNRNSGNTIVDRKAPTFTNRNSSSTSTSRNYSQSQSRNNSNYTQNRTNSSTQRSSYTPSNSSNRSSGSSTSGGGGRMSGGGGGARMGGGGRR